MTAPLKHILAQQRDAELQRAAEQTRLASELGGHHLAKLDRFLGQAQRAALRAEREFEGISIEIDAQGIVRVHAVGMTSILL
jgi:hypothetical protein